VRGRCIGLTTSPPSVSRLSIQCGILSTSQPYKPVTGIALLYQSVTVMKAFLPGTLPNCHYGLTVKQVALEFILSLTEISTERYFWGKARPARRADKLHLRDDCLYNVGSSTSHNPTDLHGLLQR
jgi:hypothetical protein